MAEGFAETKTEAPTQRRRDEARDQGQVAFSPDLTSSLVLLAGLAALMLAASTIGGGLLECVRTDVGSAGRVKELRPELVQAMLSGAFAKILELLGLLLALVFVVAAAGGALQVGFGLKPHLLAPNWERLSPALGWARLGSMTAGMRTLIVVGKVVLACLVAYWVLKSRLPSIAATQQMTLMATVAQAWRIVVQLALSVAVTLAVLGVADYAWQRWRLEQSLRMSRQEVKEEVKREEGDPQVKQRIRKLQREKAQRRMMQDVPKATVVLTNPTHLAVALRYDRQTMTAPRVLAKGAGVLAARIVQLARRHGVPVVERKPVAQALFKTVKLGQEIPVALYHAIAEVLAYVFRLRAG